MTESTIRADEGGRPVTRCEIKPEWTVEQLDNLPEGTVIEWTELAGARTCIGVRNSHVRWDWLEASATGGRYVTDRLLGYADPGSIRVVSVPIDVLLADEAVEQGLWAWVTSAAVGATRENVNPRVLDLNRHRAGAAIRAAVEHVTGGRHG